MRNLKIRRNKSFVGCAMADKVYIRDENNGDLVIEGVPCRKLGELKNGEEKTFLIDEGEQQIFLIVDKVSKDYCNATVTVPAGQEDVSYSGKHRFVLGSNPFQFDGVALSAERLAKQKKNGRKGTVIMIVSCIVGGLIGYALMSGILGIDTSKPKTFTKEDFRVTLTDAFQETNREGFFAFYENKSALAFVIREEAGSFGNISLEEYAKLVLKANNREEYVAKEGNGFLWFTYTQTVEGQEIYYMTACYKSEDAFWIVNFATPETNRKKYDDKFMQWAESVEVGRQAAASAA